MSHSVPVPPPLPTLPKIKMMSTVGTQTPIPQITGYLWASEYPALQKACYLNGVCEIEPPLRCQYLNIAAILQQGPTCGLTALSMILKDITPEQLLSTAKIMGFTNNGEMFSAQDLFKLVAGLLEQTKGTRTSLHEGRLNCDKVKECLQEGACILVPYDSDFNFAPCLYSGHKSHWALIIGYIIDANGEFYVLARHGKTKNFAVWTLKNLSKSNENLVEFSQPKGYPDDEFILPPGGIGGSLGLRERAIIIQGLPHEIINVR